MMIGAAPESRLNGAIVLMASVLLVSFLTSAAALEAKSLIIEAMIAVMYFINVMLFIATTLLIIGSNTLNDEQFAQLLVNNKLTKPEPIWWKVYVVIGYFIVIATFAVNGWIVSAFIWAMYAGTMRTLATRANDVLSPENVIAANALRRMQEKHDEKNKR